MKKIKKLSHWRSAYSFYFKGGDPAPDPINPAPSDEKNELNNPLAKAIANASSEMYLQTFPNQVLRNAIKTNEKLHKPSNLSLQNDEIVNIPQVL